MDDFREEVLNLSEETKGILIKIDSGTDPKCFPYPLEFYKNLYQTLNNLLWILDVKTEMDMRANK